MRVTPLAVKVQIVSMLCEGMGIRAIERVTGVHRDTIMRLGRDVGEGYARLHDELFRKLNPKHVELDEAWSFVHTKQAHVSKGDPREYGDQYSYVALDADTKVIIAYLVGKRNAASTVMFAYDLRERLVMGCNPQLSSDGFQPYINAVAAAFGLDANYAMIIKRYAVDCAVEAKRRYSAARVVESEKRVISGHPVSSKIDTSLVERQNLTLRMLTRRFTRLVNAFSKILRNHAAAMDLYVGYYNLCLIHGALGTTPAVAARVVKKPWTLEELVVACLDRADPDNPPVRAGSQDYEDILCARGLCSPRRNA